VSLEHEFVLGGGHVWEVAHLEKRGSDRVEEASGTEQGRNDCLQSCLSLKDAIFPHLCRVSEEHNQQQRRELES
jgi:hypothetical protein